MDLGSTNTIVFESGEVDVRDEKDGLGLVVGHHLEDGHVVALLEDGHFGIYNWEEETQQGAGEVLRDSQARPGLSSATFPFRRDCFLSSSRIFLSAPLSQKTLIWQKARFRGSPFTPFWEEKSVLRQLTEMKICGRRKRCV
ncbi:hypothetical protein EYF80_009594 [Liparis tanakae]|uniref:Uncharacterized protein n=1 Tax=Liparis tanakae TaxID=230148 RepID=A0A4Z2IQM8_9TELE|nr:hypothetical protein EYF80_009594 [Liparis tanakae]